MSFDLYACEAIASVNKTFLRPVVTLVPQPQVTTVHFITTGHSALSRTVYNWGRNSTYPFSHQHNYFGSSTPGTVGGFSAMSYSVLRVRYGLLVLDIWDATWKTGRGLGQRVSEDGPWTRAFTLGESPWRLSPSKSRMDLRCTFISLRTEPQTVASSQAPSDPEAVGRPLPLQGAPRLTVWPARC